MSDNNPYRPDPEATPNNPGFEPTGESAGAGDQSSYETPQAEASSASGLPSYPGTHDEAPATGVSGEASGAPSYPGAYPSAAADAEANAYASNAYSDQDSMFGKNTPGVGRRFLGYFVDALVVGIPLFILVLLYLGATGQLDSFSDPNSGGISFSTNIVVSVVGLLLWFGYRSTMESTTGRTVGRLATGTKVVDAQGNTPTFQASVIRNSWYIISTIAGLVPVLGVIISIVVQVVVGVTIGRDKQGRSFSDKWSELQVVYK